MNGQEPRTIRFYGCFSDKVVAGQDSSSLPATRCPARALPAATNPPVHRRRELLEATSAAAGQCLQRSSVPTCGDSTRCHSSCALVHRLCGERGRALLGCTTDRAVPESHANFENIVRVVPMLRRHVGDRVGSRVQNWQLHRGRAPVLRQRSTHPGNSSSQPIESHRTCRTKSQSCAQIYPQPSRVATIPALARRKNHVTDAPAPTSPAARLHRPTRNPRGSNELCRGYSREPARRPTKRGPLLRARLRSARGCRQYQTTAPMN